MSEAHNIDLARALADAIQAEQIVAQCARRCATDKSTPWPHHPVTFGRIWLDAKARAKRLCEELGAIPVQRTVLYSTDPEEPAEVEAASMRALEAMKGE